MPAREKPTLTQVNRGPGKSCSSSVDGHHSRLLALCGDGLQAAASTRCGLPATLLLAGLAGSLVHLRGHVWPFVLGQVMADAERPGDRPYGEWHRLAGAALVPYHLGRFTTYTVLGALAGRITSVFASTEIFRWLSAILLVAAAGLLAAQAFGMAFDAASPATTLVTQSRRSAIDLASGVRALRPGRCPGIPALWAALRRARRRGRHGIGGGGRAVAMAGFALGTVPALVMVGWGGLIMRRRLRTVARWVSPPLLAGNALVMLALASQRL